MFASGGFVPSTAASVRKTVKLSETPDFIPYGDEGTFVRPALLIVSSGAVFFFLSRR
jgi:hypothetical protein